MSQEAYFTQLEQQINQLIAEGNFKQAYQACKKYLLQFPENETLLRIKEKIEDEVRIENQTIIKNKIKELNKLLDEKKYQDVLVEIAKVSKFAPNNEKVNKLAIKAQTGYKKEIEEAQKAFLKQQEIRLADILKNAPQNLASELFYLEENNMGNPQVKILAEKFRTQLIKNKIEKNRDLLDSDKFQAINHLLEELKNIDRSNPLILKVENEVKIRRHGSQSSEIREYIYKVEKQLITLMKLKKFDKAIIVCKEILSVDTNNKLAKNTLDKAERKFFAQTRELAIDSIEADIKTRKEKYEKSPNEYIKI